jgi:hypothetical protein
MKKRRTFRTERELFHADTPGCVNPVHLAHSWMGFFHVRCAAIAV